MLVIFSAATILNAQEYKLNEKGYWYLAPVERQMAGQKKYRKQCAAFRDAFLAYRESLDAESAVLHIMPAAKLQQALYVIDYG